MKNVVFEGQIFVGSIDLPAIETCFLVKIDLQVDIFVRKFAFTGPKVNFFFIFCRLLDKTRKSRGDAAMLVVTRTLRVSPRQRNSFAFFP